MSQEATERRAIHCDKCKGRVFYDGESYFCLCCGRHWYDYEPDALLASLQVARDIAIGAIRPRYRRRKLSIHDV